MKYYYGLAFSSGNKVKLLATKFLPSTFPLTFALRMALQKPSSACASPYLVTVPYRFLFPAIMSFCCIGLYTLNNNAFDVYMGAIFAVVGYVFYKLGCEPAPLLLGFILGPMMEENLRRALLLSRGDWGTFLTRPLSAGLLVAAALMIVVVMLPSIKNKREEAFQDAD